MSRRKIAVNNNYDIFPVFIEKKQLVKSENQRVSYENYFDLMQMDSEDLFEKVENRKRFKDVVKLVNSIKKVDPDKQGELRHIYIIEGENKQDLVASAYYICLQLEQYGFIEASKIIIVPGHNFINNRTSYMMPSNDMNMGMLNKFKSTENDEDDEYANAWEESSEALLSFFSSLVQLPSYEHINKVEQYPIFILIDKNAGSFANLPMSDVYGLDGEGIKDSEALFHYIASGVFRAQIAPLCEKEFIKFLRKYLKDRSYTVSKGTNVETLLANVIKKKKILSETDVKLIGDAVISNHLTRNCNSNILTEKDMLYYINDKDKEKEVPQSNPYEQLNSFIGLNSIKQQINEIVVRLKFDKSRREAGLSSSQIGLNAVFLGSPGTAKTSVARIIAEVLKYEKFIDSSSFKEVKKSDIVGKYVGWTAAKIDEMFISLAEKGGVIFFDEIYTLSEDDNTVFDKEAITAIVQNMENNRNVFCIFAGYQDRMQQFLSKNPGLRSRISFTFKFEDYSSNELIQIFEGHVKQHSYILPEGYRDMVACYFDYLKQSRRDNFGNGREARTLFELATVKMAARLGSCSKYSKNELMELRLSDIEGSIETIVNSELTEKVRDEKRKIGFCS